VMAHVQGSVSGTVALPTWYLRCLYCLSSLPFPLFSGFGSTHTFGYSLSSTATTGLTISAIDQRAIPIVPIEIRKLER
jgi:hypothetical protein